MRLLEGRVGVVTGGAQGIGYAIAKTLAEQGATVVVADISSEAAEEAKTNIEDLGAKALAIEVDVREPERVRAMVDAAVSELGSLDVLVNNAGITRDATMRRMKLEDWQVVMDVHLKGTFLATQAASLIMREQKRGSIVNISSISGKVGMIGQINYSAAKAGIVGLTKVAAKELAHHGGTRQRRPAGPDPDRDDSRVAQGCLAAEDVGDIHGTSWAAGGSGERGTFSGERSFKLCDGNGARGNWWALYVEAVLEQSLLHRMLPGLRPVVSALASAGKTQPDWFSRWRFSW